MNTAARVLEFLLALVGALWLLYEFAAVMPNPPATLGFFGTIGFSVVIIVLGLLVILTLLFFIYLAGGD
jgi:hypothetical protein